MKHAKSSMHCVPRKRPGIGGWFSLILLMVLTAWLVAGLQAAEKSPTSVRKETVAVLDFTWGGAVDFSAGLADLFELDLQERGLDMLERRQIRFILSERRLSRSGLVRPEDAIHQALPWVHYLLKGNIEAQANSRFLLTVSLADALAGRVSAEFHETGIYPDGLVAAVQALADRLGGTLRPGANSTAARPTPIAGMSTMPEVVLRFHQALDFLFSGQPEISVPLFREAATLDKDFMVARIWEAKAYQALGLGDHARLIHEIVHLAYPGIKPLAQQELRAGIGVRTVAVTSGRDESGFLPEVTAQLVNSLAAGKGLRVFRSDWIQGLTDEMDLQFSKEFVSASGLGDRSWLFVDLIVHPLVYRDQGIQTLRIDVIRTVTGELLWRIEQPLSFAGPASKAIIGRMVKDTLQACLNGHPGKSLSTGLATNTPRLDAAVSTHHQLMTDRMSDFTKYLLHYSKNRCDKQGIIRLFMMYNESGYVDWIGDGQTDFLHQILLLRQLLVCLDARDPEAPNWLASVLWMDRGLRLTHAVCRQGERSWCDQARLLLDFVDRVWPPPKPFAYEPLRGEELIRHYDGQTRPSEPLGRAFSLLTNMYPRSLANALASYSLAIDRLNRGHHREAYAALRELAVRLSQVDSHGLPEGEHFALTDSYWINLNYFLALEAKRLGERAQALAHASQALAYFEKFGKKKIETWGKQLSGGIMVPVLGTMAICYSAQWGGKLELNLPDDGAVPGGGGEPFRPRLESGKIAPPHYDLRLELERLAAELGLIPEKGNPLQAAAAASVPAPPEQVQEEVQKLCGCKVETSQSGRPYWGYIAYAMHQARIKNSGREAVLHLQALGRRYLGMLSTDNWDYLMATTLVLLATQDYETLRQHADVWLPAKDCKTRLTGIVAKGRILLYEGGPAANSDFFFSEEPIRGTPGRKNQALFYFGEWQRWLKDFDHPAKNWSCSGEFYSFARRTALAFKLAGMPQQALQVYDLALQLKSRPDAAPEAPNVTYNYEINTIWYYRACLLEELGDSVSAATIYKGLIKMEQQRVNNLHLESDELLVASGEVDGHLLDQAIVRLQALRDAVQQQQEYFQATQYMDRDSPQYRGIILKEFKSALQRGDISRLQTLLEQIADVNMADADGRTPLHWAADNSSRWDNRFLAIGKLLLEKGARVDARDAAGNTPLLLAVRNGYTEFVKLLLQFKASPAILNTEGMGPFHYAACREKFDILELMVRNGWDINSRSGKFGETILHYVAQNGNWEALSFLLKKGADINIRDSQAGTTPLMWAAAKRNNSAMVKFLVQQGADPDMTDYYGHSALSQAQYCKDRETVAYLQSVMNPNKSKKLALGRFIPHEENKALTLYATKFRPWIWAFYIAGLISLGLALGPLHLSWVLKIWLAASLLWVGWIETFVQTWMGQIVIFFRSRELTLPFITLPLLTLFATLFSYLLVKDLFLKKQIHFILPETLWEKLLAAALGLIAVAYPVYAKFWGCPFSLSPLAGTGLIPTLMIAGILFALIMDRLTRPLNIILLMALLATLSHTLIGHGENIVILPLVLYLGYKLISGWNRQLRRTM